MKLHDSEWTLAETILRGLAIAVTVFTIGIATWAFFIFLGVMPPQPAVLILIAAALAVVLVAGKLAMDEVKVRARLRGIDRFIEHLEERARKQ